MRSDEDESRWSVWQSGLVAFAVLCFLTAGFTACDPGTPKTNAVNENAPVENVAQNDQAYLYSGWTTETDSLTDRSYRCLTVGNRAGVGLWCERINGIEEP